ncbi:hypothetical protein ABZT26_02695 [Streptomyces sp. NPDC005395]|uniref:hypothetical protein n=1 Tax=Streptomyces sp. NPDC005395 TaxID=3157042 RepID=UPI0033B94DD9
MATVGLCLADGSPIAVTVVRDCAGTTTSEGWLDLTTGAWSAGAPPAGTIACGDSRSITTNGTFCDVLEDGTVAGLVLVEYQYAADGSIASVRLVDAVTGETYTPTGEVTTCPAGVEQPERDIVQLCDVAEDGTSTPLVRDYARDATGAITGHTDYTLDGTPYTTVGTVGVCPAESPCQHCQTLQLCDVPSDTTAAPLLLAAGQAGAWSGTAANGIGWSTGSGTTQTANWFAVAAFPSPAVGPFVLDLDRPAAVEWSASVGVQLANTGRLVMPPGTELVDLNPAHQWDPATRTLSPAPGTGTASAALASRFRHPSPLTALPIASDGTPGLALTQRLVGDFLLTPVTVPFLRTTCRDCEGETTSSTDSLLDGTAYTPTGTVGVCQPDAVEPCASTVTVLRLCDLDPDVQPDEEGRRCAVPFLRHLVYDCTGALVETRDTTPDGATPYTPVEAVDCGSGGVPAMVEVPWEVVSIEQDPDSPAGRGFVFSLSPIDDPDTVGTVTVTTTATANTSCPAEPPEYKFRNPCTYTFTPDQALQDAATYVRCDLIDFDTFEPVTGLTPAPSRLGGTAYWDGTTVRATANDGVGEMYYDGPPAAWSYRVGNTGGGNSCSNLSFAAVSLRPEGCCAPCGGNGGGDGSGRTVQEVCVIASAAPDEVTTWTRVIEDGGAVIYYLDQDGARYDTTLPAGHQIVACPGEESEPCRNSSAVVLCDVRPDGREPAQFLRTYTTDCATGGIVTVTDTTLEGQPYEVTGEATRCPDTGPECQHCETLTLCDVQPAETPGGPEIAYETIPLAELPPAGSYGDGSPATGTLPNGVTYSVNVGEYGEGQGHYTFYPPDGDQVWTFDQPVYVRFGLRGLNITPTECYVLPKDAVVESISPNHTWDPDGRYLCEITGQSSALDESVFLLGPVTELPIVASGSSTGGRGPGLIQVGVPVDAPEPGTATPFLRTLCRDCDGAVISATDTTLDGEPYTPTGDVTTCAAGTGTDPTPAEPEPRVDVETDALCLVDTDGVVLGRVLVERVYDAQSGERTEQRVVDLATGEPVEVPDGAELAACPDDLVPAVNVVQLCDMTDDADPVPFLRHLVHTLGHTAPDITDTTLDGVTPYTLTGTAGVCAEPCPVQAVLEECRWDDTDGDGVGDTAYVELLAVNCEGELTSIGTYADGLTGPYTPVSPVADGPVEPAAPVVLVEPHRIELAAGSTWDAATVTLLQSVTATAHGGTGGVVTSDGTSTLFDGESVTWSVARDDDAALTGPLTISAGTGTVTVAYTRATS